MTRRYRPYQDNSEPTINLTPLIDVVFVVLIMFIVLAPLLELEQVHLAQAPSAASSAVSVQESSPLAIHVLNDNSLLFKQKKMTLKELTIELRDSKKRYPNARLQLFHDKRAYFGTYQSVKNAAEEAGFNELDLILKPS